ncbi:unnamed protein product, partial [Pylaiella littoralis]
LDIIAHQYRCGIIHCGSCLDWERVLVVEWKGACHQMDGYFGQNVRTLLSPGEQEIFPQQIEWANIAKAVMCANAAIQGSVGHDQAPATTTADELDLMEQGCCSCAVVPAPAAGDGRSS